MSASEKENLSDVQSSLEVIRHPPSFVLYDTWVDFEIKLKDSTPRSPRSNSSNESHDDDVVQLRSQKRSHSVDVYVRITRSRELPLSLVKGDEHDEDSIPELMTGTPSPIQLSLQKKKCSKRIQFKIMSKEYPPSFFDEKFSITLHPETKTDQDGKNETLITLNTRAFKLASTRLHIQTQLWDDIWYKDEGGREKCMHVTVSHRDKDNNVIKNRKVPLKSTLLYQNDQHLKVMRQEILHIFGPPKREISQKTGSTNLRFRIEDVSKNHQGQNFIVQVEEDTPKYSGIAPVFTPAVSIRSKRNKRQRTISSGKGDASSTQRMSESTHLINGIPLSRSPFSLDGQEIDRVSPIGFRGLSGDREIQRLRDAMKGVIKWTEKVVNGLYPLQWQVVGYSPLSDGSFDYNRPYHTMPNPNACISKILSMYSESTREHLRVLISAVEHTRPDHDLRRRTAPPPMTGPSMGEDTHNSMNVSSSSQRRRSPQTIHEEQSKSPYFENPQYNTRNPFHKQDSYNSAFDPPWGDRYSQKMNTSPMEHGRNMAYTNPSQNSLSNSMHSVQAPSHLGIDFPNPTMDVSRRGSSEINPIPLQMNQTGIEARRDPTVRHGDSRRGCTSSRGNDIDHIEVDDRQAEVSFVLATEYLSPRSREKLGFPAYTKAKELIGFFRESKVKPGSAVFTSTSRFGHEIGQMEMAQATDLLTDYISRKSEAVHAIEDWGTVRNLVDHAMVYDWSNAEDNQRKRSLDNSPINYL